MFLLQRNVCLCKSGHAMARVPCGCGSRRSWAANRNAICGAKRFKNPADLQNLHLEVRPSQSEMRPLPPSEGEHLSDWVEAVKNDFRKVGNRVATRDTLYHKNEEG